jgi:Zn-dependent protease with chaperone function
MVEYAAQAVTHAVVAALIVETLLRVWRVSDPDVRIRFRLLPLVFPLVVLPAFLGLAPARSSPGFRDRWALFAGSRWGETGLVALVLAVALAVGLLLFDLVRVFGSLLEDRRARTTATRAGAPRIMRVVAEAARAFGVAAPPLETLDTGVPILLVSGVTRPTLIVSRGALERLGEDEQRAALAHEVAHVARGDPALGWALMVCRLLSFFNPAVQLVVRTVTRELEWRADDLAVAATGNAEALAAGLGKLFSATEAGADLPATGLLARGQAAAIELRRRRLLSRSHPVAPGLGNVRLVMASIAITLLLFFVV